MRIVIPILAIVLAVLFVLAVPSLVRQQKSPPSESAPQGRTDEPSTPRGPPQAAVPLQSESAAATPPQDEPEAQTHTPAPDVVAAATDVAAGQDAVAASPDASFATLGTLTAVGGNGENHGIIGSLDASQGYKLQVTTSHFGAGVELIQLAAYRKTVGADEPFTIQTLLEAQDVVNGKLHPVVRYPFAMRAISINGQTLNVEFLSWQLVEGGRDAQTVYDTAVYEFQVVDADAGDKPVLRVRRTYQVSRNSYDVRVSHQIVNLIDVPLQVVLTQSAQSDMPVPAATYMGDRRGFTAAYFNKEYDPKRIHIYKDGANLARSKVLDEQPAPGSAAPLWPNPDIPASAELAWLASISRYFTVVVHPTAGTWGASAPVPSLQQNYAGVGMDLHGLKGAAKRVDARMAIFSLTSRPLTVAPGDTASLDLGIYAGPRLREAFETDLYRSLQFSDHLILYSLGGPCTMCTFQWLARLLLWFMTAIHVVLGDWGLAIIILVLCVRMALHPITKKSQIQISKFQKQFASLQPEIEKIKKKYGDNQQKIQQEQMKLMREKGINPMNMLGCLPMFLQMPIWIALYAMLFLAIELRHQPAFYGVFQTLGEMFADKPWGFLADLSEADNFIRFADGGFTLPICGVYVPYSLNILPILMGVFFFLQTKLTTAPPPNDQARQQQKIMMIMMVTIFPLMLYPAPSGLTLYIMSSSLAGMVDSLIVRKHIKQMEAEGKLFEVKKRKPGGFMERFQKTMASRQQMLESKRKPKTRKPR